MFYFYIECVQNRLPTHFLSVLMQCDVSPNSPVTPAVMPLSSHGSVKWCIALSNADMMFISCQRPEGNKTPSHQDNWLVSELQKAWMLFTKVHIYNNRLSDLQISPDPEKPWGLLEVNNSHRQFWQEGMWKALILLSTDTLVSSTFLYYT